MVGAGPNGCQTAEPADTDPDERQSGLFSTFYDQQARAFLDGHVDLPTDSLGIEGFVQSSVRTANRSSARAERTSTMDRSSA